MDATAPVLILVGTLMMAESSSIEWGSISVALPAFLTIIIQPLTFSIANGIYFGVCSSLILWITSGAWIPLIFKPKSGGSEADLGSEENKIKVIGEPEESYAPDSSMRVALVDEGVGSMSKRDDVYEELLPE